MVLSGLIFSNQIFATGFLKLSGSYQSSESGSEGATNESSVTRLDLNAGVITQKGWVLGAMYGTDKYKSDGSTLDRTGIGPTLGWVSRKEMGPYILATYFLSLERSDDYEGKGFQVDLGYRFALRKVSISPQISYKDFTYDKVGGATLSPNFIDKRIDPYIALWIEF